MIVKKLLFPPKKDVTGKVIRPAKNGYAILFPKEALRTTKSNKLHVIYITEDSSVLYIVNEKEKANVLASDLFELPKK